MKKSDVGTAVIKEVKGQHGYWLYKNGYSHWGINLYKYFNDKWNIGIEIPKEVYELPLEERIKHYMEIHKMSVEDKTKYVNEIVEKVNKEKAEKKAKEDAEKKAKEDAKKEAIKQLNKMVESK